MSAPGNLYVREDEMLGRVTTRIPLERRGVEVGVVSPLELVGHLRSNALVVVCGPDGWSLAGRG